MLLATGKTGLSKSFNSGITAVLQKRLRSRIISQNLFHTPFNLFPGKELLETLAKKLGISNVISFQNSIIKEFASNPETMNEELRVIFEKINEA